MEAGAAGEQRDQETLDAVRSVVFKPSVSLEEKRFPRVQGYDFNRGCDLIGLLDSMSSTGFQASNLGDAIDVINQMRNLAYRQSVTCKIFLGFTSNLVSSGIREIIRFLVQHRMVEVLVTTAGGIEEDLIKCLAPTYKGEFSLPGSSLRSKGLNRIGNLLVPNDNYCKFEDWIMPILDQLLLEQTTETRKWVPSQRRLRSENLGTTPWMRGTSWGGDFFTVVFSLSPSPCLRQRGKEEEALATSPRLLLICVGRRKRGDNVVWTPSKVIARLGKEIDDESSYLYWAYKNNVSVYCPALTDGSLGDMLYCHSVRNPGLLIDIVQDIRAINGEAIHVGPRKTGVIILGGGLPKHHICNANMFRNGADYAVYVNTAQEFDGSDSGALPDEAISWGKIKGSAKTIKGLWVGTCGSRPTKIGSNSFASPVAAYDQAPKLPFVCVATALQHSRPVLMKATKLLALLSRFA
ncbi:hypothetical protein BHM03_00014394 [Ensete ventricosum]|nr:hypothetical protein BHM03_00014394 [Ensete ventricosum]